MNIYPEINTTSGWYTTSETTVIGTSYVNGVGSDWERAAVKAEPDDELSWLRRRVREMEELAFV